MPAAAGHKWSPLDLEGGVLKLEGTPADPTFVNDTVPPGQFCLYLWRSLDAPGVSYLANSVDSASAVFSEMQAEGYIVKAVELESDREFELQNGVLVPVLASRPTGSGFQPNL